MNSRINGRLLALAFALAGSAMLQACAVTTGGFVPSRSVNTNRSMTSHYDVLHHQSTPSGGYRIVSTKSGGGMYDYRYY